MNNIEQDTTEVQPTIAQELKTLRATADIVTIPVDDKRVRDIVSDEKEDIEKRRLAYEVANLRTALKLNRDLDAKGGA